jgi:hypothetical protein
MNRRKFITTSSVAAVGLGATPILSTGAQEKQPKPTPAEGFWPNKARLVISLSMQFETGAQPERGASSPFPPLDPKYPDLPVQKWYDYGFKEGIPRLLDLWDRVGVKVSSHMSVKPSRSTRPWQRRLWTVAMRRPDTDRRGSRNIP